MVEHSQTNNMNTTTGMLLAGSATYVSARYVFSASPKHALIASLVIAGIVWYLTSYSTGTSAAEMSNNKVGTP